MKYALHYKPLTGKSYLQADEVIFNKVDDMLQYVINYPETTQRLIFNADAWYYNSEDEWVASFKNLVNLAKKYNVAVRTCDDDSHLIDYSEANIPYFLICWCNSWDWLHYLINLGVSDIYIVEQMGFELDKIKKVCGDKIQLRTYPDVCQIRPYNKNGNVYGFFIVPSEVSLYEDYIDVCEFFKENKEDTLYEIYTSGKWLGNLRSLISDLNQDLYSTYLFPTFGIYRRSCGKRCLKGEKCNLCQRAIDLGEELQKEGIILKVQKEIEDAPIN
ncbi:MAG: hypothetical protein J6T34_00235 [Bacilli bacterium]|nr:hypothetical protein [Bacilli bacterium]